MNVIDVVKYGHRTVVRSVAGLAEPDWHPPKAVGFWSVRDIIAHLASFEYLLIDTLRVILEDAPPSARLLSAMRDGEEFNRVEVGSRAHLTVQQTWEEYEQAQAQAAALLAQTTLEQRRRVGALPWYGKEYDLEDFIVYTFYGHKREHCSQIAVYRDHLPGM